MNDKYISGQCNIGRYESEKRLKIGIFGIVLTCAFSYIFYVFAVDKFIVFVLLFVSSFTSSIGILQYKNRFCVYYSLLNVYNFENFKKLVTISKLTDKGNDQQKALKLSIYSILIAFLYTVIYIILT